MRINEITAETTDEQILAGTVYVRAEIAKAVTESTASAEGIAKMANSLAEAEGKAHAFAIVRNAMTHGADYAAIEKALVRRLLNGPDDGWSGRSNDVRRAWFDGFRMAADDYIRGF